MLPSVEIWMVITQSLNDEMIKNSSHIEGNSVEISPIPGFISASWVGAKQVITHLVMKTGVNCHLLRPYRPIDHVPHQRNIYNRIREYHAFWVCVNSWNDCGRRPPRFAF
jgi:hypothetical protein